MYYINKERNDKIENFDFHFHIQEKTVFLFRACFQCMEKVPFCTYVHIASTFLIVRYDFMSMVSNSYSMDARDLWQ